MPTVISGEFSWNDLNSWARKRQSPIPTTWTSPSAVRTPIHGSFQRLNETGVVSGGAAGDVFRTINVLPFQIGDRVADRA